MTDSAKDPNNIQLQWDWGTAYDLFASLVVLHDPEKYGLRGSWAAGVRSRIPPAERKFLEEAFKTLFIPIHWIHSLNDPKDSATALWSLRMIPPQERLAALLFSPCHEKDVLEDVFRDVSQRRSWDERDRERLREFGRSMKEKIEPEVIDGLLRWFSSPEDFGNHLLDALQAYQAVFFAEEERRIRPALQEALDRAQALSAELPLPDLLAELSQGVHFASLSDVTRLVLVPAYWITPLIVWDKILPGQLLILFGARPPESALIPGEVIPDTMLRALKAMADPTRLRILRFLAHEALTPSQLSRRLRLRAPTVIHHLSALRMAGLVHLTLEEETEKRYTIRREGVETTCNALQNFLGAPEEPDPQVGHDDR